MYKGETVHKEEEEVYKMKEGSVSNCTKWKKEVYNEKQKRNAKTKNRSRVGKKSIKEKKGTHD